MKYFVDLIGYIAWPVTALIFLCMFKEHISAILCRLSKITKMWSKDSGIELDKVYSDLNEQPNPPVALPTQDDDANLVDTQNKLITNTEGYLKQSAKLYVTLSILESYLLKSSTPSSGELLGMFLEDRKKIREEIPAIAEQLRSVNKPKWPDLIETVIQHADEVGKKERALRERMSEI